MEEIDYKDLLRRYAIHVMEQEGTVYLSGFDGTPEEIEIIDKMTSFAEDDLCH
jgi:hypothetical protein